MIKFFLYSSISQAEYYVNKLEKIESLYAEMLKIADKNNIRTDIIKFICTTPIFNIASAQKKLGISNNTVRNNVNKLVENDKIFPDDKKRNKTYHFYDLLDIMRN